MGRSIERAAKACSLRSGSVPSRVGGVRRRGVRRCGGCGGAVGAAGAAGSAYSSSFVPLMSTQFSLSGRMPNSSAISTAHHHKGTHIR